MNVDEAMLRVQFAYPRVYLACHAEHQNKRTTPHGLSQRDASILAHMSPTHPISQAELADHMGVGRPTMSEAIRWLIECGYIERARADGGREQPLVLTERGVEAMSSSSVLERSRLARLLERLTEGDRRRAVEGLELLANAAAEASRC